MEQGPRTVLAAIAQTARRRPRFVVMEDSTRQGLTYRHLMAGVGLLARQWHGILGATPMLACAQLAGLKRIVTSRAFLERARLNIDPFVQAGLEPVYLEDVRAGI